MPEVTVLPFHASPSPDLSAVSRAWFAHGACRIEPLPAAGFSGSCPYRVRAAGVDHVLKAFAPGTPTGRIRFVHALMRHLRSRGIAEVPAVLDARNGESFFEDIDGRAWEMQAFMPGTATLAPSRQQVAAAVRLLSRVHAATASWPENPPDRGPSPGLERRISQARAWLDRPWESLLGRAGSARPADCLQGPILDRAARAVDVMHDARGGPILARFAALRPAPVGRQSVLRDVWAPHVLFAPGTADVAGLVDFQAAGIDSPATDLARLLGTWMTPEAASPEWWQARLAAYREPAGKCLVLVPVLAASGVVFGLDNWFRWILEQGRTFTDPTAVAARVDQLLAALPTALAILADTARFPGLTAENCSR